MAMVVINYIAVLVTAVIGMILGALWYSPVLFGKKWLELMKIDPKNMGEMKKKATKGYVLMFVGLLVMAYVLSHFVDYAGAIDALGGLQAGFWIWLGFIAPVSLGSVLWEGKSWTLWLINASYYLVVLLIMGAVLAVWA